MKGFHLIIAVDKENGFAKDNSIPWHIPEDFKFFRKQTTETNDSEKQNALIMGRITYERIPKVFRPLKHRKTIVVSTKPYIGDEDIQVCSSLEDAHRLADSMENIEEIYICGGERIYNEALESKYCKSIYLTRIYRDFECDRHLNTIEGNWRIEQLSEKETHTNESFSCKYQIFKYTKLEYLHQEYQYLDIISSILVNGESREDRTGTGTLATFGQRMEFDLADGFPLLTTKRVGFKTVLRELLWIIAGDTNAKKLQEKGVRIWDGNTSREFLDNNGLFHLPEGDIGELYGHFWRHWGAEYKTCRNDYTGKGIDQLQKVINQIKENPHSRRHVITAWNPSAEGNQVLTACHCLFQFYVSNDNRLSCQMYQRSADFMLGIPFNIASYSLLTHMIAHICGLKVGKFIHITGDTHIYSDHLEGANEQVLRTPRPFPLLKINARGVTCIDDFTEDMFSIEEYNPHSKIDMKMSA